MNSTKKPPDTCEVVFENGTTVVFNKEESKEKIQGHGLDAKEMTYMERAFEARRRCWGGFFKIPESIIKMCKGR